MWVRILKLNTSLFKGKTKANMPNSYRLKTETEAEVRHWVHYLIKALIDLDWSAFVGWGKRAVSRSFASNVDAQLCKNID